jgi:hypothetical protein
MTRFDASAGPLLPGARHLIRLYGIKSAGWRPLFLHMLVEIKPSTHGSASFLATFVDIGQQPDGARR